MTTFLSACRVRFLVGRCQCGAQGMVEARSLNLDLRVEGFAGDRTLRHADVEVAARAGEPGQDVPRDLELDGRGRSRRRAGARGPVRSTSVSSFARRDDRGDRDGQRPRPQRRDGADRPQLAARRSARRARSATSRFSQTRGSPGRAPRLELGDDPAARGGEPRRRRPGGAPRPAAPARRRRAACAGTRGRTTRRRPSGRSRRAGRARRGRRRAGSRRPPERSAFRTCAATSGGAPSTAISSTANADVVRAAA